MLVVFQELTIHFQVRLVQKVDTGKIYALKLLKKDEMLKKDQVSTIMLASGLGFSRDNSLPMSEPKETFLLNLIPHGWFSSIIRSKTHLSSIS